MQTASPDREGLAKMAFDEAVRTLNHQDSEVNQIRSRMLSILSISGAATAFAAGSSVFAEDPPDATYFIASIATVLLVVLLFTVRQVLKPIPDFEIEVDPRIIVEHYVDDHAMSPTDVYRDLANHLGETQERNETRIEPLREGLRQAQIAATLQVVSWTALAWVALA